MKWTLFVAMALAPQDATFVEDEWEAWNSFGAGSSVTFETAVEKQDVRTKTTITLKSKAADKLVLASHEERGEPEESTVEKPSEKPKAQDPKPTCLLCGKHAGAEIKQSKEKIKVADKEMECVLVDLKAFDCKEQVTLHLRTWYSKEVPGWKVRSETEIPGLPKSMVSCVAYSKK